MEHGKRIQVLEDSVGRYVLLIQDENVTVFDMFEEQKTLQPGLTLERFVRRFAFFPDSEILLEDLDIIA